MTTTNAAPEVLLIGRSQLVLDESVAGLRSRGYRADGTNNFADVTSRFDVRGVDVVVFGGQVPPERRAELRAEIAALNPRVVFVQGLAGIPGLIIGQVEAALGPEHGPLAPEHDALGRGQDALGVAPAFDPSSRAIRLSLSAPADVTITLWWPTSFVPPDPRSDSLVLLADRIGEGDHLLPVPDTVPREVAFATVQVGAATYAFSVASQAPGAEPPEAD